MIDPVYREVIELVDIYGFQYADVDIVLDIPVGTVMSRLSRRIVFVGGHSRRQFETYARIAGPTEMTMRDSNVTWATFERLCRRRAGTGGVFRLTLTRSI